MAAAAAIQRIVPSSAAPALSLLEESEPALQAHALRSLNSLSDAFWPEISGAVDKIQELSEDESFPDRKLAAIVAAKVNFHLGSLDDALQYALSADEFFDVDAETEFANTLRARCIDEYIAGKKRAAGESTGIEQQDVVSLEGQAGSSATHSFQAELEAVVERVLNGCIEKGEIHQAIGVAIEARRLDKVEIAIVDGCKTDDVKMKALEYCFQSAQNLISSRGYRAKVLKLIAEIHVKQFQPDKRNFISIANCYAFIGNASGIAEILKTLVMDESVAGRSNEDYFELMALQIAFDIVDNDAPFFASKILSMIPSPTEPMEQSEPANDNEGSNPEESSEPAAGTDDASGPAPMDTEESESTKTVVKPKTSNQNRKLMSLHRILRGEVTSELYLDFLCSKNKSDTYLLKKIKLALDARSSVCHSALLFSNAIAHSGTAIDNFLRDNLDWLARATAWAKFSATSCLGVIHGRHTWSALNLLSPYLPSGSNARSSAATAYSEGGALYALGLISATGSSDAKLTTTSNESMTAKEYLLRALRGTDVNDIVKHGACLGLGLATMASWDGGDIENECYEELKSILSLDSAIASEAAGLGMGLVALGSGSFKVCEEMIASARETDHEKITRGLAMGAALVCYGCEDDAMGTIKMMLDDKSPILRYGAMYAVALAYCGTADNKAIRMLLHSAVSDVSDDVRRAAVIALGFVLLRHAKMLPHIVGLLAESCHAHVRYGAAMAIGVACMGTGMPVAVNMLEKLTTDPSDFVRQGALIGLSMVLMHHTEERSPKSAEMRKTLESTWSAKLEDVITRFGAVVASGIMDAGGRNGVVALTSVTGHPRMSAVIGLAMFTQFWYWYPMVHFIGLSIKPAALICLNRELKMPKLQVQCNATEGMFAYVPVGPPEKVKETTTAPKAVLSVTKKALKRAQKRKESELAKKEGKADDKGESSAKAGSSGTSAATSSSSDRKETGDKAKDEQKEKSSKDKDKGKNETNENSTKILENPCRVLNDQEKYMSWQVDGQAESRYAPVLEGRMRGIVMMTDNKSGEKEDIIEMLSLGSLGRGATAARAGASGGGTSAGNGNAAGRVANDADEEEEGEEVPVPESFIYRDEDEKEDESKDDDEEMGDGEQPSSETGAAK